MFIHIVFINIIDEKVDLVKQDEYQYKDLSKIYYPEIHIMSLNKVSIRVFYPYNISHRCFTYQLILNVYQVIYVIYMLFMVTEKQ